MISVLSAIVRSAQTEQSEGGNSLASTVLFTPQSAVKHILFLRSPQTWSTHLFADVSILGDILSVFFLSGGRSK